MAQSALLVLQNDEWGMNSFSFDHAMEHRALMTSIADTSELSAVPYHLDPQLALQTPASVWQLNHQQAHDDLRPGVIMVNTDQTDEMTRQWWLFTNQIEHMTAFDAMPLPADLYFPRW